jgi:uncharacterized protein (TIGR04551 family)
MPSLLAATLAALLLLPAAVRAQGEAKDAPARAAAPAEVDPKVQEAIREAVEKAKEEVRDEVRAELQGAQAASEFMGAVAEGPKLELLELDGYFRVRGQLLSNFDLGAGQDSTDNFIFPVPRRSDDGGTLATSNMRLRIEPTLNVSEHVRIRGQVDVLDNYVLGSSVSRVTDFTGSPYPVPFYGSTRQFYRDDFTNDRDAIIPRRVWGEVQTPVGLLSFGRMPSAWGLGMLANAGTGIDADFGDTVDRIQFAIPPVGTPIGELVFVPMIDFDAEGVLNVDQRFGQGTGQPFDADPGDDARSYGIKIARLDTADEIRRKLEKNEASYNYGFYYTYRTQRYVYPAWLEQGFDPTEEYDETTVLKRKSSGHIFDLWGRVLRGRWRFEAELAGIYGSIGNAGNEDQDEPLAAESGKILLRQWGAVFQTEYKLIPNRISLGGELGIASGDRAPGFGNQPDRFVADDDGNFLFVPNYGAFEGPQWGYAGDSSIRNFRFNPAYQVDLILWRRIMGQVTDAWYLRPSVRWDIFPGLVLDAAVIYSQALYSESTPSSSSVDPDEQDSPILDKGSKPLGIEADARVTFTTGNGFQTWGEVGLLQPLSGFGSSLDRAWMLGFGLAVKF